MSIYKLSKKWYGSRKIDLDVADTLEVLNYTVSSHLYRPTSEFIPEMIDILNEALENFQVAQSIQLTEYIEIVKQMRQYIEGQLEIKNEKQ